MSKMDLGPPSRELYCASWHLYCVTCSNEPYSYASSNSVPLVPPPHGGPLGLVQAVHPQRTTGEGRRGGCKTDAFGAVVNVIVCLPPGKATSLSSTCVKQIQVTYYNELTASLGL